MKAPVLANWFVTRLIAPPEAEAIAGDLIEQFRRGRSRLWFCRQALAAIVIWNWRELSAHKLVAISGILTGIASLWCFAALLTIGLSSVGLIVHAVDWRWPHYIALFTFAVLYTAASGWIVGRLHPAHRRTAVFAFFAFMGTAVLWQLPLYYVLAPSIFFSTLLPHLPFFVVGGLLGAPSILIGGLSATDTTAD